MTILTYPVGQLQDEDGFPVHWVYLPEVVLLQVLVGACSKRFRQSKKLDFSTCPAEQTFVGNKVNVKLWIYLVLL